jgi:2,3-bisphosphoglycerate-dependent phosphoglycerate mutase
MQVYFIRHAQSENNAIWEMEDASEELRKSDPGLTQAGYQQAEITADYLARSGPNPENRWDPQNRTGFGLTHLYCSLMDRALLTGRIIAERLKLPLLGRSELHEVGGIYLARTVNGAEIIEELHGHTSAYLLQHYPELNQPEGIDPKGWWRGGLETREEKLTRAHEIVKFLVGTHGGTDDRIGVITHGGIYKSIFRVLFNVAPDALFTVVLNNCSITRVDFDENGVTLMYENRVDFLPNNLIT